MNWQERIAIDPSICHGKACIRGTRIPISVIVDNVAAGISTERILSAYPGLEEQDVRAAMQFAAVLVKDEFHHLPALVGS